MAVTLVGIVTLASFVQDWNIEVPMLVMLLGIAMLVRLVQE
jgi:hypothetical protein